MTNTEELECVIKASGLKRGYIAEQMGLSYYGLQKKIEGKSEFKQSEISTLCDLLNLNYKQRNKIFFAAE